MNTTPTTPVVYRTVRTYLGEMRVVTYTGSLTAQHGEYWQLETCDCADCDAAFERWEFGQQIDAPDTRWVLLPATGDANTRWARRLIHVRPESFAFIIDTPQG